MQVQLLAGYPKPEGGPQLVLRQPYFTTKCWMHASDSKLAACYHVATHGSSMHRAGSLKSSSPRPQLTSSANEAHPASSSLRTGDLSCGRTGSRWLPPPRLRQTSSYQPPRDLNALVLPQGSKTASVQHSDERKPRTLSPEIRSFRKPEPELVISNGPDAASEVSQIQGVDMALSASRRLLSRVARLHEVEAKLRQAHATSSSTANSTLDSFGGRLALHRDVVTQLRSVYEALSLAQESAQGADHSLHEPLAQHAARPSTSEVPLLALLATLRSVCRLLT